MTFCGGFLRGLRRATIFLGAVAALTTFAPAALAGGNDRPAQPKGAPCPGALGPTVVVGNLEVLPGTSCTLAGTKVLGSVYVDAAATLQTSADTVVAKDVECDGASCTLSATDVGHDLEVTAGTLEATADVTVGHDVEVTGSAELQATGATIKHDLSCDTSLTCTIDSSTVAHEVEVSRTGGGTFTSNGSRIGSLECESGFCNLNFDPQTGIVQSIVDGSVTLGYNAYLIAGGAKIGGAVSCSLCSGIEIYDSTIARDVDIVASNGAIVCNNTISGSVRVSNNRLYFITCGGNTIGGNLTLQRNRDSLDVVGNVVGGNLQVIANTAAINLSDNHVRNSIQCVANNPAPVGAGNTARRLDGQCKGLGVETSVWPWQPPSS